MDPSSEVILDIPIFRIYKDHHVDRLVGTETVPAGADVKTGVVSKDVIIDGDASVYVRLYLPDTPATTRATNDDSDEGPKLRVLVFFHGGGFITESAASPMYHGYLNSLAAAARVLVVSVNYRLAPEHPFPAGYEDSLRALRWALSGGDPWLSRHGDLRRVFLAGDSAGGNIVHNVAMMAAAAEEASDDDVAARIEGAVLLHAAFAGREPIAGETAETAEMMDTLWRVICPQAVAAGVDDPRMNPLATAAPSLRELPFERLLVVEANGDMFRGRGRAYYEGVVASGWGGKVEWFESPGKEHVSGKEHVFFLFDPGCPEAVALMDRLVAFFAGN